MNGKTKQIPLAGIVTTLLVATMTFSPGAMAAADTPCIDATSGRTSLYVDGGATPDGDTVSVYRDITSDIITESLQSQAQRAPEYTFRVSWSFSPNSISVGANGYLFGWSVDDEEATSSWNFATCELPLKAGLNSDWAAEAFAYGWSTSTSCSVTVSWTETGGFHASITDAGASYEVSAGEEHTCSDGAVFDSETVFSTGGST